MTRRKPAPRRPVLPSAHNERDALTRLENRADTVREETSHFLAIAARSYPPGVVLMLLPDGHAIQPLQRESVIDMARALGLSAALAQLGPMAPVLVLGEGRAVLMGSALGAALAPSKINAPGGEA